MIKFATIDDVDDIMSFIDTHWKKGHILGSNPELFLNMHQLKDNDISFVIHRDESTLQIDAILGFIAYAKEPQDVMGVLWKSIHTGNENIGFRLWLFLKEQAHVRIAGTVGNNKKVLGVYKALGFETGFLTQWYRLAKKTQYVIPEITNPEIPEILETTQYPLDFLPDFATWMDSMAKEVYEDTNRKPYKSLDYLKKRYYDFPIYKYLVYGIDHGAGKYTGALVIRKESCEGQSILRVVDCLGDVSLLPHCTQALDQLLIDHDCEYLDLYCAGMEDAVLGSGGWLKVKDSGNVIPNYFAPFVRENVDIRYTTTDPDIVLFKADGDQDRPN